MMRSAAVLAGSVHRFRTHPTRLRPENPSPDRIYRANNYIAIDCGCTFGGALALFALTPGRNIMFEKR